MHQPGIEPGSHRWQHILMYSASRPLMLLLPYITSIYLKKPYFDRKRRLTLHVTFRDLNAESPAPGATPYPLGHQGLMLSHARKNRLFRLDTPKCFQSEDRTHDLGIMRRARCQLRHRQRQGVVMGDWWSWSFAGNNISHNFKPGFAMFWNVSRKKKKPPCRKSS